MMQFTVCINLGNAAMLTPSDVAEALQSIACELVEDADTTEPFAHTNCQTIRDINGNDVGRWSCKDDGR